MANGTERVHRMTGETFQRLRNDHEQFLEAYEKPTQIYRFLKTRQTLKPLFLHRNLSYMPRHTRSRRNRYRKRLRVDDLLDHTKEVKKDLASEIKSDNHLKISFCGLEEGFSFKELLADDASEEEQSSTSSKQGQDSSKGGGAKLEPGQVVEVEILLLKFKQSSVRLSEGSYPYSCRSLGKQVLKYRAAEEKGEGISRPPPLPPNPESEGPGGDLTLTIPESLLAWRGEKTPGTQMLVFKATCIRRQPKKKPLHLHNFVGQKGCRKNVVVEVNRLNLGQRPKQQVSSQDGGSTSSREQQSLGGNGVDGATASPGHSASNGVGGTLCGGRQQQEMRNATQTPECQGFGKVGKNCEGGVAPRGTAPPEQQTSGCDGACSTQDKGVGTGGGGKLNSMLSKHGLLQKKSKSKLKKAKMDAAVMTEISFGTGNIPDMCGISRNPSTANGGTMPNHSTGTFSAPSDPAFSPPTAKRGFVHRCTSPKLNGNLNGLLNGYALPEVEAALKARRNHQPLMAAESKEKPKPIPAKKGGASPIYKGGIIRKRIVKIRSKANNSSSSSSNFKRKVRIPAGSGKRGTRSFLVSFPRLHYDSRLPYATDRNADAASSQVGEEVRGRRRRSQMELLLDGDKPRGQRLSETGIPVFVAEDISNRSFSGTATAGSHSPWLESSTRKITPVEHFAYPISTGFSPTKRNSGSATPNEVNGMLTSPPSSSNYRKRVSDVVEVDSPPLLLPPPVKQPKVVSDTSSSKECGQEKAEGISESLKDSACNEKSSMNGLVQPALDVQEPKVKATPLKTEATPPTSTAVFSAELVVFDSRGECLVKDGSYSILMQNCSDKKGLGLSTFEPLTWSSVFGNGKMGSSPVEEYPNLMLKLSMCWLHGPPQHKLCSELDTALDIKKIREAYFLPPLVNTSTPALETCPPSQSILTPPTTTASAQPTKPELRKLLTVPESETLCDLSMAGELVKKEHDYVRDVNSCDRALVPEVLTNQHFSKVLFNFLYSNNSLQQTESRAGWVCPWCGLSCEKIYSLLKHMSMCHPRFHFTYTPQCDGKCIINVHVNKMYNAGSSSFDRDPGERSNVSLIQRRKGPSKCLSCSAVLVEKHTVVKEDLSEFLNDGSWKRGYNTNRTYYHSRLCLPMLPKELEPEEQEMQQTLEWQNICSQKMIDEFTDVNGGEKELMKLWNIFSMENKIIAGKQIPGACLEFASKNGKLLREKGLVPNLMSHLVNLYDCGLITPGTLRESMAAAAAAAAAGVS